MLALAALLLGASVSAAVHHAEVVAVRVGQPFGSVLLALAVTVIEASLIISIMLSAAERDADTVPPNEVLRDTIFAAVMLVLNGIVGLCLLIGGLRHREQSFQPRAASAALGVLGTLATLTLILPTYTVAETGAVLRAGAIDLRRCHLAGALRAVRLRPDRPAPRGFLDDAAPSETGPRPSGAAAVASGVLMLASLAVVILLAELLSPAVEAAIHGAGLPAAAVGVVIAAVTLLPEGVVRGARRLGEPAADEPQPRARLGAVEHRTDDSHRRGGFARGRSAAGAGARTRTRDPARADAVRLDADARHREDDGAAGRGASGHSRRVPHHRRHALS